MEMEWEGYYGHLTRTLFSQYNCIWDLPIYYWNKNKNLYLSLRMSQLSNYNIINDISIQHGCFHSSYYWDICKYKYTIYTICLVLAELWKKVEKTLWVWWCSDMLHWVESDSVTLVTIACSVAKIFVFLTIICRNLVSPL
jgi:hypothetical protein